MVRKTPIDVCSIYRRIAREIGDLSMTTATIAQNDPSRRNWLASTVSTSPLTLTWLAT